MSATKRYLGAQEGYGHSPGQPPAMPPEEHSSDHTAAVPPAEPDRPASRRGPWDDTVQLRRQQPYTFAPAVTPPTPVRDAEGYDLQPDPLAAMTASELIAALREYRAWAGDPPYRAMATQARQAVAHSTMYAVLNGNTELPKLKVVIAIIAGCGGSDEEQRTWATAWRRIALGKLDVSATVGAPTLRVVPQTAETTR